MKSYYSIGDFFVKEFLQYISSVKKIELKNYKNENADTIFKLPGSFNDNYSVLL